MKQIVPFTKRIELENNIEEITSISLDHTLSFTEDNEIKGELELYLEYKENDISVNTESYTAKIPFDIALDDKYILDNSKVEIDDFYYEIEDNCVILHIDILVDGLELVEEELENIIPKHEESLEEVREELEIDDLFKEIDTDSIIPLEVEKKDHIK
jgi:hypothetical protein